MPDWIECFLEINLSLFLSLSLDQTLIGLRVRVQNVYSPLVDLMLPEARPGVCILWQKHKSTHKTTDVLLISI